jgi:hypothetical protein
MENLKKYNINLYKTFKYNYKYNKSKNDFYYYKSLYYNNKYGGGGDDLKYMTTFTDYIEWCIRKFEGCTVKQVNEDTQLYFWNNENNYWEIECKSQEYEKINIIIYKISYGTSTDDEPIRKILFCKYIDLKLDSITYETKKLDINQTLFYFIKKKYPHFPKHLAIDLSFEHDIYIFSIQELDGSNLNNCILKFDKNFNIITSFDVFVDTINTGITLLYNLLCFIHSNMPNLYTSIIKSPDFQNLSDRETQDSSVIISSNSFLEDYKCDISDIKCISEDINDDTCRITNFNILKLFCYTDIKLDEKKSIKKNIEDVRINITYKESQNETLKDLQTEYTPSIQLTNFLFFLRSLLPNNIDYYFIEKSITSNELVRGWYFLPIKNKDNIIYILKIFGCNCIDLVNICRIKYDLCPAFGHFHAFKEKGFVGSNIEHLPDSLKFTGKPPTIDRAINLKLLDFEYFLNEEYRQNEEFEMIRYTSTNHDFYGSYKMWFLYFLNKKYLISDEDKQYISKLNETLILDEHKQQYISEKSIKVPKIFTPGTLLIGGINDNHVAIVSKIEDNLVYIIHSFPNAVFESTKSTTGFEEKGIQETTLLEPYTWENKDIFKLAIPFENWMCHKNLELTTIQNL